MDRTYCNGEFHLRHADLEGLEEGGHGHVDLRSAMVQSCDVFFYQYGLKVGPEAIARYARAFGLGSADRSGSAAARSPGSFPSPEGRRERGRPWQPGTP